MTIDANSVESIALAGLADNKIGVQAIIDKAEIVAIDRRNCRIVPT